MPGPYTFLVVVAAIVTGSATSAVPSFVPPSAESAQAPTAELNLCPCFAGNNSLQQQQQQLSALSQHLGADASPATSLLHGMSCSCHFGPTAGMRKRDDYTYVPDVGAYKLHTRAATWNEARKTCNEEGGHLAIVNSEVEAIVLRGLFNKSGPIKGATYEDVGYIGIHDFYKEGEWVTVLGDSLYKTGFTGWSNMWGGQPDNGGGNQNCGAFHREGKLDDVNCDVPFAFFCELPTTWIIR